MKRSASRRADACHTASCKEGRVRIPAERPAGLLRLLYHRPPPEERRLITSPMPARRHMRAISAAVVLLPEPAEPARISARRAEVSTQNAAAAWSGRSPL